jgi:erythronate-4-phosphate dehydrogenase
VTNHPQSLHIVADENIPIVHGSVPEWAQIEFVPSSEIGPEKLAEVDALFVRSVTRVDERLLRGTPISFVGTATTGVDHIDLEYLASRGIAFADAAGSNATSVVDYVLATIAVACRRDRKRLQDLTVGIVGLGRIGSRLADRLEIAGMRVLRCDTPRQELEGGEFATMEKVLSESDLVTLHVPLNREGAHPTYHLIDSGSLRLMRAGAWLVNTSRGAVVDNRALRTALEGGLDIRVAIDVWEGEPAIDVQLLRLADLATPHIAGYAFDGKIRGGQMMLDALAAHFDQPLPVLAHPSDENPIVMPPDCWLPETDAFIALAGRMYDIEDDDRAMRTASDRLHDEVDIAAAFAALRKSYPVRRELGRHVLGASAAAGHQRAIAALGIGQSQIR